MSSQSGELAAEILCGSRRALARALSAVENRAPHINETLETLYPYTGRAHIVGITGAPGTGKSTLVTALALAYRERQKTVGIIAVDPTSPFSGGAILGDRIRMRDLSGDSGIFIRSMATRGNLGGLSAAARDAARLLDAAGYQIIMVETVGAGQNEVSIARMAHTTLVVEAPGMGDEIQAIKAGILEIADILVVNKADRPGAKNTVRALRTMIETGHPSIKTRWIAHHGLLQENGRAQASEMDDALWIPPIVETIAHERKGIEPLVEQIAAHRAFLSEFDKQGKLEQAQIELELIDRLRDALLEKLLAELPSGALESAVKRIQVREAAPHEVVTHLINQIDFEAAP